MLAKYLIASIAACAAALSVSFALAPAFAANFVGSNMKQSVTYLHLMKTTPFFNALDRAQKKWVIAHSTEWEAQPGTVVSNRADANDHVWVLLDGGWQVEQGGRVYAAGHADPAKMYGGAQAALLPADSRLVANRHSYVMRIKRADFEEMLQRGLDFSTHVRQGEAFYRSARTAPGSGPGAAR